MTMNSKLVSGGSEPIRKNHFELYIDKLGRDTCLAIREVPDFGSSNNVIEIAEGNKSVKIAGKLAVDGGDIVLDDLDSPDVVAACKSWREQVYNPASGRLGRASDYKSDGVLQVFDVTGTMVRELTLIGIWPSSLRDGNKSSEEDSPNRISLTLSIDEIR